MKFATAILIFSATGHASAGGPVSDPAPAAPAAAAAAPDTTEKHPRDPGSNLRRTANGASTGVDVAAAQPDHQRRLQDVGSEASVYVATAVSVATCTGVGQNLATTTECGAAAASLGFGAVLYTDGWDSAPPGCICEPTHNDCWFNTLSGGPAREDRFLVCKDTQASFYAQQASHNSDMLALQEASSARQASYNFGMLSQQAAGLDANDPGQSAQIAMHREMLELQAAGLGPDAKTDNGHLAYPYAATLDPTGTSRQTAFDSVGLGWPGDSRGNVFYYSQMEIDPNDGSASCEDACLGQSAVVHGLVGYAYCEAHIPLGDPEMYCFCQYDTAVAYTDPTVFTNNLISADVGTGRITVTLPNRIVGTCGAFERSYEL